MPEKQKTHDWTEVQTMIAAGAMLGLMALFNVIASLDRQKVDGSPDAASALPVTPTFAVEAVLDNSGLTPVSDKSVTRTGSS